MPTEKFIAQLDSKFSIHSESGVGARDIYLSFTFNSFEILNLDACRGFENFPIDACFMCIFNWDAICYKNPLINSNSAVLRTTPRLKRTLLRTSPRLKIMLLILASLYFSCVHFCEDYW